MATQTQRQVFRTRHGARAFTVCIAAWASRSIIGINEGYVTVGCWSHVCPPFDEDPSHRGVLLWEGRPRPEAVGIASGRGRPSHNASPCCRGLCEEQHLTVKEP